VSVYRRFNQWKELSKRFGSRVRVPFPSAKPFEGRKFDYKYLAERGKKLSEYLSSIYEDDELLSDEYLIKWLGLHEPEDPLMKEVFDLAFYRTKRRLWIWKRITYDEEGEAIAELVIEQIKDEMWIDIKTGLPNQAKMRKLVMQVVYNAVKAIVTPIVTAGWKEAQDIIAPLKEIAKNLLLESFDKILEIEENIKVQLLDAIKRGINPVMDALKPLLNELFENLSEPNIRLFKESTDDISRIKNILFETVQSGDENKCGEIKEIIDTTRIGKLKKLKNIQQRLKKKWSL